MTDDLSAGDARDLGLKEFVKSVDAYCEEITRQIRRKPMEGEISIFITGCWDLYVEGELYLVEQGIHESHPDYDHTTAEFDGDGDIYLGGAVGARIRCLDYTTEWCDFDCCPSKDMGNGDWQKFDAHLIVYW